VIPCCLFWKRYNLSQMAMPASNCTYTLRLNRLIYVFLRVLTCFLIIFEEELLLQLAFMYFFISSIV